MAQTVGKTNASVHATKVPYVFLKQIERHLWKRLNRDNKKSSSYIEFQEDAEAIGGKGDEDGEKDESDCDEHVEPHITLLCIEKRVLDDLATHE